MTRAANLASLGSNASTTGILPIAGGGTAGTNGAIGFKNRIINGGMTISQRNGTSSVTGNDSVYGVDRFVTFSSQTSKLTVQQNAGSVTPPTGFGNYLGYTSTSAYSVTSGDYIGFVQHVEGFNTADLMWGTSSAATVTLSFWVRSSLTGTFGGSITNSAQNYCYPFSYTISSANTWEQKTITIAGPTSGTWIGATNGRGLSLYFSLGMGSTYSGTAGSWASGTYFSCTGSTSVVGTNGATFYITGVQLEVGTTATNFDFRAYGTELALCQRYCTVWRGTGAGVNGLIGAGAQGSNIFSWVYIAQPVSMRATPTASWSSLVISDSVTFDAAISSVSLYSYNGINTYLDCAHGSVGSQYRPVNLRPSSGSTGYMIFSAEL